ncbi:MAG: hypothetical protein KGZ37_07310 [Nitrosarchaeum sp.]|nr:hypothetical protein [Nitrosarchaeum sp.]
MVVEKTEEFVNGVLVKTTSYRSRDSVEVVENQNQESPATEEVANETPTIPDSQNHYG